MKLCFICALSSSQWNLHNLFVGSKNNKLLIIDYKIQDIVKIQLLLIFFINFFL